MKTWNVNFYLDMKMYILFYIHRKHIDLAKQIG
jgi:hypothetical protein